MDTQTSPAEVGQEAPQEPAWASKARSHLTYRASRRNLAKRRRRWQGGTIRDRMEDGQHFPPVQKRNFVSIQPVYYQKYSKTSAKVYRGGNVSGSVRRFKAKYAPTEALKNLPRLPSSHH